MPWCDQCSRYLTPTSLQTDGSCPSCQTVVAEPPKPVRAPWHFWVLVVAVTVYLGWRLLQGVGWLAGRF